MEGSIIRTLMISNSMSLPLVDSFLVLRNELWLNPSKRALKFWLPRWCDIFGSQCNSTSQDRADVQFGAPPGLVAAIQREMEATASKHCAHSWIGMLSLLMAIPTLGTSWLDYCNVLYILKVTNGPERCSSSHTVLPWSTHVIPLLCKLGSQFLPGCNSRCSSYF